MPPRQSRPKLPLPEDMLALTELDPPALAAAEVDRLDALLLAPPEQFQEAVGDLLARLVIQGFRQIRPPRNYKEQATVIDLWRKFKGLDAKEKGPALPQGIVGVMRTVSRRQVVDVPAEGVAGSEEPGEEEEQDDSDEPVFD